MRVAISAVQFNSDRLIGAQRPRAIAAELVKRGHDVTVFAPEVPADESVEPPPGVHVVTLPRYSPRGLQAVSSLPFWQRAVAFASVLTTVPRATVLASSTLSRALRIPAAERTKEFDALNRARLMTVGRTRSLIDARTWVRQASLSVRDQLNELEPFDAIFSTYGPFGSLWFGRHLKRLFPAATWVSDIRDPMVYSGPLKGMTEFLKKEERQTVREADFVTVVSEGVKSSILRQKANRRFADKIHVLPNGFLRRATSGEKEGPGPLRIVYTGQVYGSSQDATPLFRAIATIKRRRPDLQFEVHYAGHQGHIMRDFARSEDLESVVVDHGSLTHSEAVGLQDSADMLLVLSWNRKDSQGIISGKFGEYLAASKPLLSLVSGDHPGAELSGLVRTMNVGCAYEAAEPSTFDSVVEFLEAAAERRSEGMSPAFQPNSDEVAKFDYANIVARLEQLFQEAPASSATDSGVS